MHDGNDDATIRRLLSASRRIALVGASARPDRPSNGVTRWLIARGWEVVPVNPGLAGEEIEGRTVFASLAEVPGEIDLVEIFRRSDEAGAVVDAAIARGVKAVWLQLGVIDQAAAARARAAGIAVVMDCCPAIEGLRLGVTGPARRCPAR
jgi:predicted CoA-binding protein